MKLFRLFAALCAMVVSMFCVAEQEATVLSVKPMKKIEVEEVNFDTLPKESQVGDLAEWVSKDNEENITSPLISRIKHKKNRCHTMLYPQAEELAFVNGQLCHIGYHAQSIIYTVLDGPYYGTQTTTALNGIVLYVNYDYIIENGSGGNILHHYYSDCEVITGSNQVICFY